MRTTAGASAMGRFADARGRSRRWVLRPFLLVAAAPLTALLLIETVWGASSLDWVLGIFFGAIVGALIWVWDAPPAYIENWRRGAAGERMTARALRALEHVGWHVRHDVLAERGNRDHIVLGPSGVYLLDTKALGGVVRVDGDVVASTVPLPDWVHSLDEVVATALRMSCRTRWQRARGVLRLGQSAALRRGVLASLAGRAGQARAAPSAAVVRGEFSTRRRRPPARGSPHRADHADVAGLGHRRAGARRRAGGRLARLLATAGVRSVRQPAEGEGHDLPGRRPGRR